MGEAGDDLWSPSPRTASIEDSDLIGFLSCLMGPTSQQAGLLSSTYLLNTETPFTPLGGCGERYRGIEERQQAP